jgi:hypothetical protein
MESFKGISMDKIMGVFKYDTFPYMVVMDIIGWDADGNVEIQGGYVMKASALITVFPKKQGEEIKRCLFGKKQRYNKKIDEIKKELMDDFFEKYPTLEKKDE